MLLTTCQKIIFSYFFANLFSCLHFLSSLFLLFLSSTKNRTMMQRAYARLHQTRTGFPTPAYVSNVSCDSKDGVRAGIEAKRVHCTQPHGFACQRQKPLGNEPATTSYQLPSDRRANKFDRGFPSVDEIVSIPKTITDTIIVSFNIISHSIFAYILYVHYSMQNFERFCYIQKKSFRKTRQVHIFKQLQFVIFRIVNFLYTSLCFLLICTKITCRLCRLGSTLKLIISFVILFHHHGNSNNLIASLLKEILPIQKLTVNSIFLAIHMVIALNI